MWSSMLFPNQSTQLSLSDSKSTSRSTFPISKISDFVNELGSMLYCPQKNPNLLIQETDQYTLRIQLLDNNKMSIELDYFSLYDNKCIEYYRNISDEEIPALIKCIYDNVQELFHTCIKENDFTVNKEGEFSIRYKVQKKKKTVNKEFKIPLKLTSLDRQQELQKVVEYYQRMLKKCEQKIQAKEQKYQTDLQNCSQKIAKLQLDSVQYLSLINQLNNKNELLELTSLEIAIQKQELRKMLKSQVTNEEIKSQKFENMIQEKQNKLIETENKLSEIKKILNTTEDKLVKAQIGIKDLEQKIGKSNEQEKTLKKLIKKLEQKCEYLDKKEKVLKKYRSGEIQGAIGILSVLISIPEQRINEDIKKLSKEYQKWSEKNNIFIVNYINTRKIPSQNIFSHSNLKIFCFQPYKKFKILRLTQDAVLKGIQNQDIELKKLEEGQFYLIQFFEEEFKSFKIYLNQETISEDLAHPQFSDQSFVKKFQIESQQTMDCELKVIT